MYVSVPADIVDSKVVGLALVPPYTLYDAKSLSLLADQVNTTWAFPAAAARLLGVDGAVLSITIALFAPREFVAPGDGNVNVAAPPNAVLLMVPLFSASADVLA